MDGCRDMTNSFEYFAVFTTRVHVYGWMDR